MRLRNKALDPLLILAGMGLTLAVSGWPGNGVNLDTGSCMLALFSLVITTFACVHSPRFSAYFLSAIAVATLASAISLVLHDHENSPLAQHKALLFSTFFMMVAGLVSREFYLFKCGLIVKGILTQKSLQSGAFTPISAHLASDKRYTGILRGAARRSS